MWNCDTIEPSGVKEWDATNSTIPDGLATLAKTTGWKFQMHNRMWSDNNVYARQNGGNYDFVVEPLPGPDASTDKTDVMADSAAPGESGLAIPDDQDLWDDLIVRFVTVSSSSSPYHFLLNFVFFFIALCARVCVHACVGRREIWRGVCLGFRI